MIGKEDIDNVRSIMVKSKKFATTDQEKEKLEELIKGFDRAADRYMQEVQNNARL